MYPLIDRTRTSDTVLEADEPNTLECDTCGSVFKSSWLLCQHCQLTHEMKIYRVQAHGTTDTSDEEHSFVERNEESRQEIFKDKFKENVEPSADSINEDDLRVPSDLVLDEEKHVDRHSDQSVTSPTRREKKYVKKWQHPVEKCTTTITNTNSIRKKKRKCPDCGKTFLNSFNLQRHSVAHGKPHRCRRCKRRFLTQGEFEKHSETCGAKTLKCDLCEKMYSRPAALKNHINKKTCIVASERVSTACDLCGKIFKSERSMKNHHYQVHAMKATVNCDICGQGFKGRAHLQDHTVSHSTERPYKCDVCPKSYKTKKSLKSHINISHLKRPNYFCEYCSESFFYKKNYIKHVNVTHTGTSVGPCEYCGKMFSTIYDLTAHLQTHNEKKKAEAHCRCEICDKAFANPKTLKDHSMLHTDTRPYVCEMCGHGFIKRFKLNEHITRVHLGVKRLTCKYCGKSFSTYNKLYPHVRIHTGERPYKCKVCSKTFRLQEVYKTHVRVHTGEKPYSCKHCGKAFSDRSAKIKHTKTHKDLISCVVPNASESIQPGSMTMVGKPKVHAGIPPYNIESPMTMQQQAISLIDQMPLVTPIMQHQPYHMLGSYHPHI